MNNKRNNSISISILDVQDLDKFLDDVNNIKGRLLGKNNIEITIHFDVMDGKFVKNNGVKLEYIRKVKEKGFFADVHLMVENPVDDMYIDKVIEYGADSIIIHYEIANFDKTLEYLRDKINVIKNKKILIGVAIKPNTDVKELIKIKDKIDIILVMSVKPGFGGQKYLETTNNKLKEIHKLYPDKYIEVDGGINIDTIKNPIKYNVNGFVIGSYITNTPDISNMYKKISDIINLELN